MSKFYLVRFIRTLTTETVIEVDDPATEEDILNTARNHAAGLAILDFDEAEGDAEMLALDLEQIA